MIRPTRVLVVLVIAALLASCTRLTAESHETAIPRALQEANIGFISMESDGQVTDFCYRFWVSVTVDAQQVTGEDFVTIVTAIVENSKRLAPCTLQVFVRDVEGNTLDLGDAYEDLGWDRANYDDVPVPFRGTLSWETAEGLAQQ